MQTERVLYCIRCADFISNSTISSHGVGMCQACNTRTCANCRPLVSRYHGLPCTLPEEYLEELNELAAGMGWRQCPARSGQMIESNGGCPHTA